MHAGRGQRGRHAQHHAPQQQPRGQPAPWQQRQRRRAPPRPGRASAPPGTARTAPGRRNAPTRRPRRARRAPPAGRAPPAREVRVMPPFRPLPHAGKRRSVSPGATMEVGNDAKLWGRANSSNVMKVIWLLEELSLPYERIDVGGPFGRTREPDYVAMNPNSVVPTLRGGGRLHPVGEQRHPALPGRAHAHGRRSGRRSRRRGPRSTAGWTGSRPPSGRPAPWCSRAWSARRRNSATWRRSTRAVARLATSGRCWTRQLARHDYIAGPDFTLADIASGVHVHRWFSFMLERPDLPHLRAWYDRLLARPAYRQHCATPMT